MKFRVILEYDRKARSYVAYCPELPGCASTGHTEQEALENSKEPLALYLEPSPVKISPQGKIFEVEVLA